MEWVRFRRMGQAQSFAIWVGCHRGLRVRLSGSRDGDERIMVPCPHRRVDWEEGCEHRP